MRTLIPTLAVAAALPASAANWYEEMQIGPVWSNSFAGTFDGQERTAAVKGILVDLGDGHRALFDTETLRVVSAYKGGIHWGGTPWTGQHGSLIRIANEKEEIFSIAAGPGWADEGGGFEDRRPPVEVTIYDARRNAIQAQMAFGNLEHARFKGFYRHATRIVFEYKVLGTKVLEYVQSTPGGIVRHFEVAAHSKPLSLIAADEKGDFERFKGSAVAVQSKSGLSIAAGGKGATLEFSGKRAIASLAPSDSATSFTLTYRRGGHVAPTAPFNIAGATKGGEGLWKKAVTTKGETSGDKKSPWVADTIAIPEDNPWKANMRVGGFDFIDEDSAAISTWNGDVWVVKGIKGDLSELTWKRFASGLFDPLGLKVVDGVIHVHGRDQISKLHDLNGDGEADHYEVLFNGVAVSPNFHEFAFDLQTDPDGNFYFSKGSPVRPGGRGFDTIFPHHGIVGKVSPDGSKFEVVATGLRAPGGLGVGPNGEITTGENEGSWQPRCKLNFITKDQAPAFFGVEPSRHDLKDSPLTEPLCYFPMEVDNSSGSQVWVPKGNTGFGLKEGELIHLSYGRSSIYRVLFASVGDTLQGGVVKLPVKLRSSAMRARFHPDGSLFVCGLRGWQTNAASEAGFQRIRYTGAPVPLPDKLEITKTGVRIRFEVELDEELATDPGSYSAQRWNYVRGPQYGSGEFSVDHPDPEAEKLALEKESQSHQKRDDIEITAARLLDDRKTIELDLAGHKPSMQLKVAWDLETAEGDVLQSELHATVRAFAD